MRGRRILVVAASFHHPSGLQKTGLGTIENRKFEDLLCSPEALE